MSSELRRDVYGRAAFTADAQGRAIPIGDDGGLVVGWLLSTWSEGAEAWEDDHAPQLAIAPYQRMEAETPDGGRVLLDVSGYGFRMDAEEAP